MSAKRELKIKINDGEEINLLSQYNFYLIDAPFVMWGAVKDYETISFAEENGIIVWPHTALEEFDYKVRLCYVGNEQSANSKISAFMQSLFDTSGASVVAHKISLINDFHKQTMVGYPKSPSVDSFKITRSGEVITLFDLTILVDSPSDCIY